MSHIHLCIPASKWVNEIMYSEKFADVLRFLERDGTKDVGVWPRRVAQDSEESRGDSHADHVLNI